MMSLHSRFIDYLQRHNVWRPLSDIERKHAGCLMYRVLKESGFTMTPDDVAMHYRYYIDTNTLLVSIVHSVTTEMTPADRKQMAKMEKWLQFKARLKMAWASVTKYASIGRKPERMNIVYGFEL